MALLGSARSYGFTSLRWTLEGIAALFLAAVAVGGAYGAGLITVFGYEHKRDTWGIPFAIEKSLEVGLHTLLLFEGQTYYVRYEVDIVQGELWFGLNRLPMRKEYRARDLRQRIAADAAGEATWRVPATGFYSAYFYASSGPRGGPHDVTYTVTWGARFQT